MSTTPQPRAVRVSTEIEAMLIDSDGGELPVVITDLSRDGFRLKSTEELVKGETVRLGVSRYGDFKAQIIWVAGHSAGGRFLENVIL